MVDGRPSIYVYHAHGPWLRRYGLYAAFAAVIAANLIPIWLFGALPMGDLGGHIELMDVALRYDSPLTAYAEYYRLPSSWFRPNALSLIAARWLGPALGIDAVVRMLLSSYVIGLPLGMAALARATGRSVWLGLFGAALTYNAVVNVGFLNFLIGIPLLLFATAQAVRFAARPSILGAACLVAWLLAQFTAHAMLFMITTGIVVVVLLALCKRPRDLWGLMTVVPGVTLFGLWLRGLVAEGGGNNPLFVDGDLGLVFESIPRRVQWLHQWGLRYFRDASDDIYTMAVLTIWGGLLWSASKGRAATDPADEEPVQAPRGTVQTWMRRHVPVWIALGCLGAVFLLPARLGFVDVVAQRAVLLTYLFAALIPWQKSNSTRSNSLYALLAVLVLAYSVNVAVQFRRFEREAIGDLRTAIADLPDRSLLSYVMYRRWAPITFMGTVWHLPKAFHALDNGGITDDSFAINQSCPIRYRNGKEIPRLWRADDPTVLAFDHLLTRGESNIKGRSPTKGAKHLVFEQGEWTLYRIGLDALEPSRLHGGTGGEGFLRRCHSGQTVTGVTLLPGEHAVAALSLHCGARGRLPHVGRQPPGIEPQTSACPIGDSLVGFEIEADSFVRRLTPLCSPMDVSSTRGKLLICSGDHVVVGVYGRAGAVIDSLGILCAPHN